MLLDVGFSLFNKSDFFPRAPRLHLNTAQNFFVQFYDFKNLFLRHFRANTFINSDRGTKMYLRIKELLGEKRGAITLQS